MPPLLLAQGHPAASRRRSSRITIAGLQTLRPRGVGTPRAVNGLAIPLWFADRYTQAPGHRAELAALQGLSLHV